MSLGPRGCTEWEEDIPAERSAGAKACAGLHMSSAASAGMEELPVGWGLLGLHVGVQPSPLVPPLSLFEALNRKDETLTHHWEKH